MLLHRSVPGVPAGGAVVSSTLQIVGLSSRVLRDPCRFSVDPAFSGPTGTAFLVIARAQASAVPGEIDWCLNLRRVTHPVE